MAKSLKDLKTEPSHISEPVPLELMGDTMVPVAIWLYEDRGIPTPISGDPINKQLGEN